MSDNENNHEHEKGTYYLPGPSHWPIMGSIALTCIVVGAANWLHDQMWGPIILALGAIILIIMLVGWFGTVIRENQVGLLADPQVDRSFRWAMFWFIFTEVMFFGAFFGALFYTRFSVVPSLAGYGQGFFTHILLWPGFQSHWPLLHTPNPLAYLGPKSVMETWGIPAINTAILLSSGVTITIAHWGVIKQQRTQMILAQAATIILGISFFACKPMSIILPIPRKG